MRRRSLTIVEVAMAVVILGGALVPLVGAFSEAARATIGPVEASTAAFLVTERMEQIVAARYRSAGGYANVVAGSFPNEASVSSFTAFARSVTVQEVAADLTTPQSGSGIKKVTVTVTWQGGARQVAVCRVFTDF